MTPEEQFRSFKEHILKEAKAKMACAEEYRKAAKAEDMAAFCAVVRDNFRWLCSNKVLTGEVIDAYPALSDHGIRHNVNASEGVLLVTGSATVEAWGSATVEAWGSATVLASDSATVRASGSATVEAWGSATVRAWGSATVEAWGSATVRAWGSATVRAWGSAYIHAPYGAIECELDGHAILRHGDTIKGKNGELKLS